MKFASAFAAALLAAAGVSAASARKSYAGSQVYRIRMPDAKAHARFNKLADVRAFEGNGRTEDRAGSWRRQGKGEGAGEGKERAGY